MKHFAHASRFAGLLLSLFLASRAHADWLDGFPYSVAVSNSMGGPFSPTANLWTQTVPAGSPPASIDLVVYPNPHVTLLNGNAYLDFATVNLTMGASGTAPLSVSHVPYFIRLTLPNMSNLVLSGDMSSSNIFGPINFTNNPASLALGGQQYSLAVQAMPAIHAASFNPGEPPPTSWDAYELFATIPASDLAQAPEPSALLLAGMGGVLLVGAAWRRRRPRSSLA